MSEDIKIPYELPEGWKWVRLDSIAELKGGKRIPAGFRCTEQITPHVYIRVSDMQNDSICMDNLMYISEEVFQTIKKYTISKNDLYLTIAGTIGRVGTIPDSLDNMNLTENALKITNIKCDKKYLLYSLKSEYTQNYFSESYHQVAMPKLSMLNASKTLIPLPPTLEEQQRIVNLIETLFAKLNEAKEKAQNVVDIFEIRKASILHKSFTGELTKKWRKENGVGDDSWEEKKLEDAYIINPKCIADDSVSASFIPMEKIEAHNVNKFSYNIDLWGKIKKNHTQFQDGDVCFAKISPCFENGKAFIAENLENGIGAGTTELIVLRNSKINTHYTFYLISDLSFVRGACSTYSGTVGQQRISMDYVKNYIVHIPSLPEQQEIVRVLDTILEKENQAKEAALAVLEQIDLLKKSILVRAFRGEL